MCGGAIVDFTPLSDNAAFAALRLGLPYLGICINDDHLAGTRQRLNDRMFAALTDPTSEFFEAAAVAELEHKEQSEGRVPGARPKAGAGKGRGRGGRGRGGGGAAAAPPGGEEGADKQGDADGTPAGRGAGKGRRGGKGRGGKGGRAAANDSEAGSAAGASKADSLAKLLDSLDHAILYLKIL